MTRVLMTPARMLAAALLVALGGCGDKEPAHAHRKVEGIIESIDQANSEVTLRYFSDKHKAEMTITGAVTSDTEILINGVISNLADLRPGERVTVAGWARGHGSEREVVAERIWAERATTIRRQSDAADDGIGLGTGSAPAKPDPAEGAGGQSPETKQ